MLLVSIQYIYYTRNHMIFCLRNMWVTMGINAQRRRRRGRSENNWKSVRKLRNITLLAKLFKKPPMRVMMCGKQKVDIKSFIQLCCDMKLSVSSPPVGRGNSVGKFSRRHFSLGFIPFSSCPLSYHLSLCSCFTLPLSPIQFWNGFEFSNDTNQQR